MKNIKTADLCDDYIDELKVALPIGFNNYGGKKAFHGEIVTIKCLDNNPLVRATLSENGKGKVLVVDGEASKKCALAGDNIAQLAFENEWAGIIINGCIRDSEAIGRIAIGVKALYTNPIKSGKLEVGKINIPITFANVTFYPGEYVYSDEDGIVISKTPLH
ncbi:ribonuclease E activity regulator RraA [Faecalibacter sp. LW9]|uniref:ribonuclease E activity regulator RraA n=1 Tax=Faecalibacter sp. LW9 TaxID=3103144 RepID=UPI002AFE1035|nr:ribonuclease E activity regulator RraA [Faecalibacter sp. LW9]